MRLVLAVALVLIASWAIAIIALVASGRRSAAHELAALLPNLVALFRGLLRDPRVDRTSKVLLWIALAWVLSPIDLIPEFIPVAGPLDDAIIAALVLRHVLRSSGAEVVSDHWRGDHAALARILRLAGVS